MLGGDDPNSPPTFDVITSIGVDGTLDLMGKYYVEEWGVVENSFPNHLKSRGFTRTEPSFLKDFAYKEDGFLVWDAIQAYVEEAMAQSYTSDSAVAKDEKLQAWFTAMRTGRDQHGAEVRGMPVAVRDVSGLVDLLTSIIWQASAQHSAVNFGQWEYYAFIPNRPLAVTKPMPEDLSVVTEEYILSSLPSVDEVYLALVTGRSLSLPTNRPLFKPNRKEWEGQFGHSKRKYPVRFPKALAKFTARLAEVEKTVAGRNDNRRWPYPYLQPSNIPSSIDI